MATLALLEAGTAALVELGVLETPPPRYGGTGFWRGHHPTFGVWHEADAEIDHQRSCFRATYRTNSVGARDVERSRDADGPRVVMLGDSFIEGWGLPAEARLSNRLELATGVPHLNFGMSHFGPYQQFIVYRDLASGFEHSAVIAGIVPANDFLDLDLEKARDMARYEYRYRPYLVGDPPDLRHLDWVEPDWRRRLRRSSYLFNAVLQAARSLAVEDDEEADAADAPRRPVSHFYDFGSDDLGRLEGVLERLAQAAEGRPVAVVLIPTEPDLARRAVAGPPPLVAALSPLAERLDLRLVDLLTPLAQSTLRYAEYYFPCDYHWNARANAVVQEWLVRELGSTFYDVPEREPRPNPTQTSMSSNTRATR